MSVYYKESCNEGSADTDPQVFYGWKEAISRGKERFIHHNFY